MQLRSVAQLSRGSDTSYPFLLPPCSSIYNYCQGKHSYSEAEMVFLSAKNAKRRIITPLLKKDNSQNISNQTLMWRPVEKDQCAKIK